VEGWLSDCSTVESRLKNLHIAESFSINGFIDGLAGALKNHRLILRGNEKSV
jgi:hypothetical protein